MCYHQNNTHKDGKVLEGKVNLKQDIPSNKYDVFYPCPQLPEPNFKTFQMCTLVQPHGESNYCMATINELTKQQNQINGWTKSLFL